MAHIQNLGTRDHFSFTPPDSNLRRARPIRNSRYAKNALKTRETLADFFCFRKWFDFLAMSPNQKNRELISYN